jgi:hypothetical protein
MRYGRQAFGPGKKMTVAEKARNVAQSIVDKERRGQEWRWTDYGLENNESQIIRVWNALHTLRTAA